MDQNEAPVIEMTHKFLDYIKTVQLEATDAANTNLRPAKSKWIEIRMSPDRYPIIPKLVIEKELNKAEWEKLLRAFLTQVDISIKCKLGVGIMSCRSSQWKEVETGALQCNEDKY